MRIVQFQTSDGRRLGVVEGAVETAAEGELVRDVTSVEPGIVRVIDAFERASESGQSLAEFLEPLAAKARTKHPYSALLANRDPAAGPVLYPPVDPADPHAVEAIARREEIDFTVIGPELPLSRGVADGFAATTYGPTRGPPPPGAPTGVMPAEPVSA